MYGLRLNPPTNTTGLTITNNWCVYNGWSSENNYFAGGVCIATTTPTSLLDINGDNIRLRTSNTPSDPNSGNTGDIRWDDNFIYIRTSTG